MPAACGSVRATRAKASCSFTAFHPPRDPLRCLSHLPFTDAESELLRDGEGPCPWKSSASIQRLKIPFLALRATSRRAFPLEPAFLGFLSGAVNVRKENVLVSVSCQTANWERDFRSQGLRERAEPSWVRGLSGPAVWTD